MTINAEHEYAALRQEMLERFQRIHDTLKWGVGGFIAFLSFYLVIPSEKGIVPIPDSVALIIMWTIIAFIGLSTLHNYKSIYQVGTYIAFNIENSSVKWHRMSRKYKDYLKDTSKVTLPWGSDSRQLCSTLIILFSATFFIIYIKTYNWLAWIPLETSHKLLFIIGFLFLISLNIYLFISLFRMDKFRENTENQWKEYNKIFDTPKYFDYYEKEK